MKTFRIAVALLLALSVSMPLAQPPAAAKDAPPPATGPLLVDVHPSPYRLSLTYTVKIGQQRFEMRNATIVNMIDYVRGQPDDDGREDLAVAGGPTWIDLDRFDVVARIPDLKAANPNPGQPNYGIFSATPDPSIQPIVERILTERFHLKIHPEDRPLPGYIMTMGRGGAKLTEAKTWMFRTVARVHRTKRIPDRYSSRAPQRRSRSSWKRLGATSVIQSSIAPDSPRHTTLPSGFPPSNCVPARAPSTPTSTQSVNSLA
jgi:uncharacterized protein (TIGR03435 family)